jgi:hypothetical protein
MPHDSAHRLAHADTSPDLRPALDADAPASEHRGRTMRVGAWNNLLELANEAHEKELGCVRLCALAEQASLTHEHRVAMEKRGAAAQRRVDALRSLGHLLGLELHLSTHGGLRRALVQRRVAAMVEAIQMALDADQAELAESVARESVVQARVMAELTWRALSEAARRVQIADRLRGSGFDASVLGLSV